MPGQDSRTRLYRSYVSTHTRADTRPTGTMYFPVLGSLPVDRSARILDIGCGEGSLLAAAERLGYTGAAGIDVSAEQVELARRQGLRVEMADAVTYLNAHPSTFDAILATDVLEHFDRDEVVELLESVHAALRPGGVFLAQVPNAVSPFFGNYAYGDFTHRSVFTARSVRQLSRAIGFHEPRIYAVNPLPHGVISSIRRLLWSGFAALIKLALAAETGQLRGHLVTQNIYFSAQRP